MSLQFPEHFIRSKVFAFKRVAAFEDSLRFLALSGLGRGGGGEVTMNLNQEGHYHYSNYMILLNRPDFQKYYPKYPKFKHNLIHTR